MKYDFRPVVDYLNEEVKLGLLPGAVLLVGDSEKNLFHESVGFAQVFPTCRPMKKDTIFDIASLTKVVATTTAIMMLVEREKVLLNECVGTYLPIKNDHVKKVTIWNLLTHTSGLPLKINLVGNSLSKDEIIDYLNCVELIYEPGTEVVYSDLGFMTLGLIVEAVSGVHLNKFVESEITVPLQMTESRYNPPVDWKKKMVATEFRRFLGRYQWGEVHDRTALAMKGVSGHAGLFANAENLSHFARCFLNDGIFEGKQLLKKSTINQMFKNQTPTLNKSRGIGWEVYQPNDDSFGGAFSSECYGHTGFTGTSLLFIPKHDLFVILLTNRIHYGRTDDILHIRKQVHKIINEIID